MVPVMLVENQYVNTTRTVYEGEMFLFISHFPFNLPLMPSKLFLKTFHLTALFIFIPSYHYSRPHWYHHVSEGLQAN